MAGWIPVRRAFKVARADLGTRLKWAMETKQDGEKRVIAEKTN